jgi:hypothetical protein
VEYDDEINPIVALAYGAWWLGSGILMEWLRWQTRRRSV